MFFDTSSVRLPLLVAIATALAGATLYTSMLWFANRPLERAAGEAFARARSTVTYTLRFKLPGAALAAIGPAGAAGLPAAAPPTTDAVSVPVLLYHGESGGPSMTTATFVAQLKALHDAGWRTLTLAQFEAFMRGEASVPDKSFLLTFDDGRTDTFYTVDPVLKDLHYTAVMFVITGLSLPGNGDTAVNGFYLNKAELAFMAKSGRWELESHGAADHGGFDVPTATSTAEALSLIPSTHFLSNLFWLPAEGRTETVAEYRARIESDLASAKDTLAGDFGTPVTAYAYPFNDFGQESVNLPAATSVIGGVVRNLYEHAFYQTWPGNGDSFNYPGTGTYRIKRIEPDASWSAAELLAVLAGGHAKTLPYENAGPFGPDWQANWGSVAGGGVLTLAATNATAGAAAFLDGSEGWGDYIVTVRAQVTYGTLSLIARHTETAAPYLVCAFSSDHIYLEEHAGDTQRTLATARYAPPALGAAYRVTMTALGTHASCSAYGVTVRAETPDISSKGGIGMSVWDPETGQAGIQVQEVSVNPT